MTGQSMRTADTCAHRRVKESRLLSEPPPTDAAEIVALLSPTLSRIRPGELRMMLTGVRDARDRAEVAMFQSRFMELIDLLGTRA